jgi:hypothetical protein
MASCAAECAILSVRGREAATANVYKGSILLKKSATRQRRATIESSGINGDFMLLYASQDLRLRSTSFQLRYGYFIHRTLHEELK